MTNYFKEEEKAWRESIPKITPQDFNLTDEEAKTMRLSFLQSELETAKKYRKTFSNFLLSCQPNNHWFVFDELEKTDKEILNIEKRIYFLTYPPKNQKTFDLEEIKKIPIEVILDRPIIRTSPNRYKTLCVAHEERNPSMVIYEENNHAHCFSCGFHGSVIDVFMRLNDCDFVQACKSLFNSL